MPRHPSRRTNAPTICPACENDKARVEQRIESIHEPDVVGDFWYDITACDVCGEELLSFEQAVAHARAYAATVARARNSMLPDRIYVLRHALGWSQGQMEEAFGVGPKTWGRWERGTVAPTGPAAKLMWLAENDRSAFLRLVDAHRRQPRRTTQVVGTIVQQGIGEPAAWFRPASNMPTREARVSQTQTDATTEGAAV